MNELKIKLKYCTLNELVNWCKTQECLECEIYKYSTEYCPINAFNNFISMNNLEDFSIPINSK